MLFNIIIIDDLISSTITFKYRNDNKSYYLFNAKKKKIVFIIIENSLIYAKRN